MNKYACVRARSCVYEYTVTVSIFYDDDDDGDNSNPFVGYAFQFH